MLKFQTVAWLGATAALTSACAPMPMNYYDNNTNRSANYDPAYYGSYNDYPPVQPYFASYHPYPSYTPSYSQQMAEPADAPMRRALLAQAYQSLGVRYKYGGTTPNEGFDCSGLTSFVYKQGNGIRLPRTAAEQSRASRTISFEQMRPGDLIFFRTSGSGVNHVGIYVGRGDFIHAASGGGRVTLDNLSKTYWQQRLVKFGTFTA